MFVLLAKEFIYSDDIFHLASIHGYLKLQSYHKKRTALGEEYGILFWMHRSVITTCPIFNIFCLTILSGVIIHTIACLYFLEFARGKSLQLASDGMKYPILYEATIAAVQAIKIKFW